MTNTSDEKKPGHDAMTNKPLPESGNPAKPTSDLAENVDGFGLPKGKALADAIDEIALRLKIPREQAREIALHAIATLQDEIGRRGLPADDMLAPWMET